MAYTKTAWENRNPDTPINETNLNKIEQGIEDAHITADAAAADTTSLDVRITAAEGSISQNSIDATSALVAATAVAAQFEWRTIGDGTAAVACNDIDNLFMQVSDQTNVDLTLPTTPIANSTVRVVDAGQDFSTNTVTLLRGANLIMGLTEDLILDIENTKITLVWSGATYGWAIVG